MTSGETANAFVCLRIPQELVDALAGVQEVCQDRVEPQDREHIHITLGFLHGADERKLADARALISQGAWSAPVIRLTGAVRHRSWSLASDPAYHYDEETVQKGEQVRLGVELTAELARIQDEITRGLDIVEEGFWPHVTLGLARKDFPAAEAKALELPTGSGPAPSVDLQREVSATEFSLLVRKDLTPA